MAGQSHAHHLKHAKHHAKMAEHHAAKSHEHMGKVHDMAKGKDHGHGKMGKGGGLHSGGKLALK